MQLKKTTLMAITTLALATAVYPQKTWNDVYTILNTSCQGSSCHESGSSNNAFTVDTTAPVLYAQLINQDPKNPYADSVGHKLVVPGSPLSSFLLRKISHCDSTSGLGLVQPFEGASMPESGNKIPDAEIELIYNWIVQGASDTAVISPDTVAGDVCALFPVGIEAPLVESSSISVYPNPASGKFSFTYTLIEPSLVTIDLLDLAGKKVESIFAESQASGNQVITVVPDAKAGVYFVRLTVGTAQYMRKVALY